jgi:hypothetical protein
MASLQRRKAIGDEGSPAKSRHNWYRRHEMTSHFLVLADLPSSGGVWLTSDFPELY